MASKKELNEYYQSIYHKDFPSSTLSKWKNEGRIRYTEIPEGKRIGSELYDYNFEDFKKEILNPEYAKRVKATKEKPQDYIGKQSGDLLITGIVPRSEYKEDYKGTLMYCKCLKCNRPDLVQVRFSYLTPNGNYHQTSCGCDRKIKAFMASTRPDLREDFLDQFGNDFDKFLFIHKMLTRTTDKYYYNCPLDEYENVTQTFFYDNQFNAVYDFWKNHSQENQTFYDWAKPSLDHIIPKSKGGDNELNNLQVLTVFENLAKRDMTWEEWEDFKNKTHTHSDYFIESIMEGGKDSARSF